MSGRPISFMFALSLVCLWTLGGLLYGFSDTWMLVINTIATINASLMVFIIQNTQNRESKALHLKIDELLLSIKEAERELVAIEEKEEEELDVIREKLHLKKHPKRKI